jgi:hypothetical protein
VFPPGDVEITRDAPPLDDAAIDGPPADRDGDGVADDVDNCPDAINKSQHDEDLDGLGDHCDNCPWVPNVDQGNADGDGLGTVCDDAGESTTDCLALFAGFGDDNGWESIRGSWTVGGDVLTQTDVDASQALIMSIASVPDGLVFTQSHVEEIAPPTAANNIGVWGRAIYTAGHVFPDGLVTEAHHPSPGLDTYAITTESIDDVTSLVSGPLAISPQHSLAVNDKVHVALDMRPPTTWLAGVAVVGCCGASTGFPARTPTIARIGLRTHDVRARFDYALVLTRPPAGPCPAPVIP